MKHTPRANPALVMLLALSGCGPGLEPDPGAAEIPGTPGTPAPTDTPTAPPAPLPPGAAPRPRNCGVLGTDTVASMVVLPDGKSFAAGLASGNVAFFAPPRAGRARTLAAHVTRVTQLEVTGDGGSLATRAGDGEVAVWNAATGERRFQLAGQWFARIAFSPDGTRLVAAGRSVSLVRSSDGAVLWSQPFHPVDPQAFYPEVVEAVFFSADGSAVTAAGAGGAVTYRAADGTETGRMPLPDYRIEAVSSDGARMLGVTRNYDSLAVIDGKTGQALWTRPGRGRAVAAAAFSPDGSTVTYALYGRPGIVASSGDGAQLLQLGQDVEAATYSRDGRVLAYSIQGRIYLDEVPSGAQVFFDQIDEIGHHDAVFQVAFSPDGNLIGSMSAGSNEEALVVWRVRDGAWLHGTPTRPEAERDRSPEAFAFSPDSSLIARTAEKERALQLIDAVTGARIRSFDLIPGAPASVEEDATAVAFSPDGQTLAVTVASSDQFAPLVRTYRVADGLPLPAFTHPVVRAGSNLSFSPGGDRLAVREGYAQENAIVVYRTSDRTLLWTSDPWEDTGPLGMGPPLFSPDGKLVVAMNANLGIRVFSADSGLLQAGPTITEGSFGASAAFSPDGRVFAVGQYDRLLLFRTSDWSLERQVSGSFISVAFSPDGSTLAAGTYGGAVHLLCDLLPGKP